ncbi:MAG TPA: TonB-dependent receptor, partial [Bryobacteraceae bacterium]|nr:TonB-dependent receptor [Bryobacteraceae bacterium]
APDYPSVRHTTIPSVKLDWNPGASQKLSFYWSFTHTDSQYSPTYGNSDGLPLPITTARGTFIHSHIERLNYERPLGPQLLLHAGVGYQQNQYFDDSPVLNYDAQALLGLNGATLVRNFPTFNGLYAPGNPAGGMASMGPPGQAHFYMEKPEANASLAWVRGNHTYKAGAEFRIEGYLLIPYTATNGVYTFSAKETAPPYLSPRILPGGSAGFGYASFLLGAVDSVTVAAPSETREGKKQFAFFLQDSWKISRKLTLDYGLRWDYGTYPREQYGRAVDFSPLTPNPSSGGQPGATIFEGDGPGRCGCAFAHNYPFAFGPRLGIAYQVSPGWVFRGGWGVVYDQTGSAALPGVGASTMLSSPGNAVPAMYLQAGIPIAPAWPVFSAGVDPVPGTITPVPSMLDPNAGRPARQSQWSLGVQRELTRDFVIEASYIGNRGVWWPAGGLLNINALTPQRLAAEGLDYSDPKVQSLLLQPMNNPAVVQAGFSVPYNGFPLNASLAQALRPFPQFGQTFSGSINVLGAPLGKTWYDSLQIRATKRLSHGLTGNVTYTWQKSLQEGVDTNAVLNNVLANPANAKGFSSFDQPQVFAISGTYAIPKLPGSKLLSYALRDWQIGGVFVYASGQPIPTPEAATNIGGQLFQNTLANRAPGVPLSTVDLNCHCFDPATTFVLNPKAWVNPPQGQFGTSAEFYNDFRYQRHPRESLNLGRSFRWKDRYRLSIRIDFQNVFNRTFLNGPVSNNPFGPQAVNPVTHLNSVGFGYIRLSTASTQFGQPRQGTIVARFEF